MPFRLFARNQLATAWAGLLLLVNPLAAADYETVKSLFRSPPTEYCTAPLWVWADDLSADQIVTSLRELAAQNVRQVFIHPRPGLMTPYLSEKWFALWQTALDEAERLDMNVWIYDENSYPSGFAGGLVPDAMPEARAVGLAFEKTDQPPQAGQQLVGVYRISGQEAVRIASDSAPPATRPGEEVQYLVFKLVQAETTPWLGGKFYVDLMRPEVTRKFMEVTHEAYARRFRRHFGKRIPGIFTDEPHVAGASRLPWTPGLPDAFRRRFGYDLLDVLPALVSETGDWRRVRHDYWAMILELFIEGWARPQSAWCAEHSLEWTGHYWEHEWPRPHRVPDNMAMYAWHQRPAIDTLFNRYDEGVHAQFGNTRAVKELASVANQLGRRRTLCEAYGASGWDLRFEDMKRIGDWLYVLGVNTLDEHLAAISIRGARKYDHPQSFSYHEPWWPDYHVLATYFARLSAVMSQGEQRNQVLVMEPTTTAWMYAGHGSEKQMETVGQQFQALVQALEMAQIEFDLGSEDIITRHGSVSGPKFVVGQRAYTHVVIPPLTENLEPRVAELLAAFLAGGGQVLCAGDAPVRVGGRLSDQISALAGRENWVTLDPAALPARLAAQVKPDVLIQRASGDKGILFHHRRILEDGQILFLVNTSVTDSSACRITARGASMERWEPLTGQVEPYAFTRAGGQLEAACTLPPCGSLLLFIASERRIEPAPPRIEQVVPVGAPSPSIRRLEPNVLTLDYVDVSAGGETRTGFNVIKAASFVFARHGLRGNPWDRAVQLRDELIRRTFPPDSGFTATCRFTIRGSVPADLAFVVERADLYTITCNGRPVAARAGDWWLDRQFGRIDISRAARVGENEIVLRAEPMTMYHELANAYVLGDFALEAAEQGFVIVPAAPLRLGAWNEQGMPLYGGAVRYAQEIDLPDAPGRYRVRLPRWYGSLARVSVNGKPAGIIFAAPWTCDVTPQIRPGRNLVEVTVVGTLKNTLGPHHKKPALGIAGPFSWDAAPEQGPPPGTEYATVAYGLWEPPVIERVEESPAAQ